MTFDSSVELALQEVRKEKANALIQSMNEGAFSLIDDQGLDIPSGFEIEEYKAINKFSSLLPMDVISQIFSSSINENIITVGSDGNNYWIKMQSENIPTDEEIKRYLPFISKHIEIINPKILVLLGSTAMNALIGNEVVISKMRGKWIEKKFGNCKTSVIITFHPAFLMRQPAQKKMAWIDLKMIRDKKI